MQDLIQAKLDELRGLLQADGGDLELVRIEGKNVFLRLTGACGHCPHAAATLRNYVEHNLRESIDPEITVERVK
ncbi:MAG: NifU family protein [Kiritimatiellaeota bacterium]|nr:NifU family protein [Kiritimatiellota bacterium]